MSLDMPNLLRSRRQRYLPVSYLFLGRLHRLVLCPCVLHR